MRKCGSCTAGDPWQCLVRGATIYWHARITSIQETFLNHLVYLLGAVSTEGCELTIGGFAGSNPGFNC